MSHNLSFDLHVLTARLDRSADRLLQAEYDISYRRFLTLLIVGEFGTTTQRGLAEHMGVTEPSVSRMIGVLAETGLLDSRPDPAGGNRRRLALTGAGEKLVEQCRESLERRFADLVERSGVPYADYARHTRLLMTALDTPPSSEESPPPSARKK